MDKFNTVLFIGFKGVFSVGIMGIIRKIKDSPIYLSQKLEGDYKFWGEIFKVGFTGAVLTTIFQQCTSAQQDKANQVKYEQELVNKYTEDVKDLLLKEYRSSGKDIDPEITHEEIANFVASKTSSLLRTITDAEQRQRLINFLKYSSIATIPEYRYPLYFPDNICSRVSRVKSKYYADFLCTLNLTSDQKRDDIKGIIVNNNKTSDSGCLKHTNREYRTDLTKIVMSDMILEKIDFRTAILENALFDRAQLDHAGFGDALLDESNFYNTDLQYVNMNCAQLKGAKFSNSYMKGATLSKADLSKAKLVGSNLRNANLSEANLSSAYLGVNDNSYTKKIPTRNITDLRGADLSLANLAGAELVKVDLRRAILTGVEDYKPIYIVNYDKIIKHFLDNLSVKKYDKIIEYFLDNLSVKKIECQDSIADIFTKLPDDFKTYCSLKVISPEAILENANLSGFDLSGEDLQDANLRGADLRKTDLRGTDLTGIKFNSDTNFEDAIYDKTTNLPNNLKDLLKELKKLKDSPKEELKNLLEELKELKDSPKEELKDLPKDEPEYLPEEELKNLLENLKDLSKKELKNLLEKLKDTSKEKLKDLPKEEKENLQSLLELQKMLVFNDLVKITDYDKVPKETPLNETDLSFIDLQYVNLSSSNLTGVNLLIANLSYARLFHATLTKAYLEKANLTRANLEEADLTNAILKGANLIEANLRHATLTNADLQETLLIRTDLRGAKLSQAILERLPKLDDAIYDDETELPFSDKKAKDYGMWKIAPGSDLKGAILRGVDLRDANLCDAVIDDKTRLDGALFNENTRLPKKISPNSKCKESGRLSPEDIRKAQDEYNMVFIPSDNWKKCDKSILKLRRANLPGVEFKDADLSGADLSGANLIGTYWKVGVNLKEAKFTGADLRNATFGKVDLSEVELTGADLRGANLSDAKHLSVSKLNNIRYDRCTQFPPGIKPPSDLDLVCKS